MQLSQRHARGELVARMTVRLRVRGVRPQAGRRRPRGLAASGEVTSPVRPSVTISSGPPASEVVSTGLCERNASNGTIPKSSSTGA